MFKVSVGRQIKKCLTDIEYYYIYRLKIPY